MSYTCGYNDGATARAGFDPSGLRERVEWIERGQKVHVTRELLETPEAREFIEGSYRIGDWCPEAQCFHADRIEAP